MRTSLVSQTACVAAAAFVCFFSAPASGETWDAADRAALRRGEAVVRLVEDDDGPGGRLQAAIDIAAAPSAVWPVMIDCAGAPNFVPRLESCSILETGADGGYDLREHKVQWIPLLPRLTLQFRSDYVVEREIRVHRTGGDLSRMEGVWRLEPIDGGRATRLHYDFSMATQTPLPRFIVRGAMVRDTPGVLEAVRAEVMRRNPS